MPLKVLPIVSQEMAMAVTEPFTGLTGPITSYGVRAGFPEVQVTSPEPPDLWLPRFWAEVDKVCTLVPTSAELDSALLTVRNEAAAAAEALKDDLCAKLNGLSSNLVLQSVKDEILNELKSYIDSKFKLIEARLK